MAASQPAGGASGAAAGGAMAINPELVAAAAAMGVNLPELMASGSIPAGVTSEMVVIALRHKRHQELQRLQQQQIAQLQAARAQAEAAGAGKDAPATSSASSAPTTRSSASSAAAAATATSEAAPDAQAKKPHVLVLTPFPRVDGGKEKVQLVLQRLGWVVLDQRSITNAAIITDIVVDPTVAAAPPFKQALDEICAKLPSVRVLDGCVLMTKLLGQAKAGHATPVNSIDALRAHEAAKLRLMQAQQPPLPAVGALPAGGGAQGAAYGLWDAHPRPSAWKPSDALQDAERMRKSDSIAEKSVQAQNRGGFPRWCVVKVATIDKNVLVTVCCVHTAAVELDQRGLHRPFHVGRHVHTVQATRQAADSIQLRLPEACVLSQVTPSQVKTAPLSSSSSSSSSLSSSAAAAASEGGPFSNTLMLRYRPKGKGTRRHGPDWQVEPSVTGSACCSLCGQAIQSLEPHSRIADTMAHARCATFCCAAQKWCGMTDIMLVGDIELPGSAGGPTAACKDELPWWSTFATPTAT